MREAEIAVELMNSGFLSQKPHTLSISISAILGIPSKRHSACHLSILKEYENKENSAGLGLSCLGWLW